MPRLPLKEKKQFVLFLLSVTCPNETPNPPTNAKLAFALQKKPLLLTIIVTSSIFFSAKVCCPFPAAESSYTLPSAAYDNPPS
ncbi:hypothetical protein [Soonwooa purpurea]